MDNSVLIVAAHPDDEVLGCGGTMAKLADNGTIIHVAFIADGISSRDSCIVDKQAELVIRQTAAKKACAILGVKSIYFGNMPDNSLDTVPMLDIVKVIESLIVKYKPSLVLTHFSGDLNIDHTCTHLATDTACRPQFNNSVKTLLSFEIPSSTEWRTSGATSFSPNWFVDITDTLDRKLAALELYESEMRDWPHPRSQKGVEHLAHWRGATVGLDAAEAFVLGRKISYSSATNLL